MQEKHAGCRQTIRDLENQPTRPNFILKVMDLKQGSKKKKLFIVNLESKSLGFEARGVDKIRGQGPDERSGLAGNQTHRARALRRHPGYRERSATALLRVCAGTQILGAELCPLTQKTPPKPQSLKC